MVRLRPIRVGNKLSRRRRKIEPWGVLAGLGILGSSDDPAEYFEALAGPGIGHEDLPPLQPLLPHGCGSISSPARDLIGLPRPNG